MVGVETDLFYRGRGDRASVARRVAAGRVRVALAADAAAERLSPPVVQWVAAPFRCVGPCTDFANLRTQGTCGTASVPAKRSRTCASAAHSRPRRAGTRCCTPGSALGNPGGRWARKWSRERNACPRSTGFRRAARTGALPCRPRPACRDAIRSASMSNCSRYRDT